ncbi:MAG: gluconeogenesis factor YvcK family protein [Patescibacteria group bacterium]
MLKILKKWWLSIAYDPNDPRYGRGEIKIVAIGGGTGLSNLLRGLKKYSNNITAVVTVSDSGSSSGVIRKVFKTLPPGDIRKCLAALSDEEKLLSEVFEYRFPDGSDFLSGHPFGNIWLAALIQKYGSFEKALEVSHSILDTVGKVYPSTLDHVQLGATFENKKRVFGEDKIPQVRSRIKKIYFNKKTVRAYKNSVESIKNADLIILGPGSLFTSVIPNILIPGISKAIKNNNKAYKIFIANCSTERGETENFSITDHIDALTNHGGEIIKNVLINNNLLKKSKLPGKIGEINNITSDLKEYDGYQFIYRDLIDRKMPLYHDREKLAKEIILLYNEVRKNK